MIEFFTNPVLRPSTLGSMLMCFSSAIIGVVVYLRRRSLIGETLSHATFPGIVLGVALAAALMPASDEAAAVAILVGAFLFAWLGLKAVNSLENRFRVKSDSALCFVLASFFGLGVLLASRLQSLYPLWSKQAIAFLYGQAATMTNQHVVIYTAFACFIVGLVIFFYRYIEAVNFDALFCQTLGIPSKKLDQLLFLALVLAIVIGIRSVGVVLMAGMLICPALAARPLARHLFQHFAYAGAIGMASGWIGNYLSVVVPQGEYSLPTGPMILLTSTALCLLSLLLAPQTGLLSRYLQRKKFRLQCAVENGLKSLWKKQVPSLLSKQVLCQLKKKGWADAQGNLTESGNLAAQKIIRLHRLWEVYLVDYLGQSADKVHRTAEELEHFFSPELERQLSELLHHPERDPHHQPIPPGDFP
jgi:manganese/zinc/iron transport system permease protein